MFSCSHYWQPILCILVLPSRSPASSLIFVLVPFLLLSVLLFLFPTFHSFSYSYSFFLGLLLYVTSSAYYSFPYFSFSHLFFFLSYSMRFSSSDPPFPQLSIISFPFICSPSSFSSSSSYSPSFSSSFLSSSFSCFRRQCMLSRYKKKRKNNHTRRNETLEKHSSESQ